MSFIPHLVLQTVSTNSSNRLQLPTNMSLFLSPDTEEERKRERERKRWGERERERESGFNHRIHGSLLMPYSLMQSISHSVSCAFVFTFKL